MDDNDHRKKGTVFKKHQDTVRGCEEDGTPRSAGEGPLMSRGGESEPIIRADGKTVRSSPKSGSQQPASMV